MERELKVLIEQAELSLSNACDEVAEWLRRWTANPMCSARVGSNPILVVNIICFLASALREQERVSVISDKYLVFSTLLAQIVSQNRI